MFYLYPSICPSHSPSPLSLSICLHGSFLFTVLYTPFLSIPTSKTVIEEKLAMGEFATRLNYEWRDENTSDHQKGSRNYCVHVCLCVRRKEGVIEEEWGMKGASHISMWLWRNSYVSEYTQGHVPQVSPCVPGITRQHACVYTAWLHSVCCRMWECEGWKTCVIRETCVSACRQLSCAQKLKPFVLLIVYYNTHMLSLTVDKSRCVCFFLSSSLLRVLAPTFQVWWPPSGGY